MTETVNSASDARTVNNTMRHQYRVLSDEEKAAMVEIKDAGAHFLSLLHAIGGSEADSDGMASPALAISKVKIEEAVMWAVKHITA